MRSVAIVIPLLVSFAFTSAVRSEEKGDAKDILCGNAPKGSVEALPQIVADWVVVICTPTGQALAPAVKSKPVLWVATKTGAPWILEAVPRQFNRPDSMSKYDLRFTNFAAEEYTGQGLEQVLKMWDSAFAPAPRPRIDRVVQLDARTVWGGAVYELFFYISQGKPRWLIACADRCNRSVSLRVEESGATRPTLPSGGTRPR
jgi:hypothetical protein